jgi:transmembrane 9 superfamily protein 2/4
MCGITLLFAALGFLSPSNRGSLATMVIVLYFLCGALAGYVSARIYKTCGGQKWRQNVFWTMFLVPGCLFTVLLIINFFLLGQKSSSAVPFGTLFVLLSLWFFLSTPLGLLGAFYGFKKDKISVPVRTLQIPRQVPDQPMYLKFIPAVAFAGILPFGALFIELFYILNSIWNSRIYYVFGFLTVIFWLLMITSALVSILVIYFALCSENYHWYNNFNEGGGEVSFLDFQLAFMYLYTDWYITSKGFNSMVPLA